MIITTSPMPAPIPSMASNGSPSGLPSIKVSYAARNFCPAIEACFTVLDSPDR